MAINPRFRAASTVGLSASEVSLASMRAGATGVFHPGVIDLPGGSTGLVDHIGNIVGVIDSTGNVTVVPTTPAATPPSPTPTVSALQAQVTIIPVARDGQPITVDYHNSLRSAVLAIAQQLGTGPVSATPTMTLAPNFAPHPPQPAWGIGQGFVQKADGATAADGWFQVQMPQGALIQQLTAYGNRAGNTGSFHVALLRQPFVDTGTTTLLDIDLGNASSPFQVSSTQFQVPALGTGATAAATADYQTVDNARYKYLVTARLIGADAGATAQITAIQIVYQLD